MEDARQAEMVSTVFTFVDLSRLYSTRIEELGVLKTAKEGHDILFVFQEDIGQAFRKACEKGYDDVAMHLATAAKIMRKEMLEMQATFMGSMYKNYQQQSVPPSMLEFVAMIHEGASIKAQSNKCGMTQATITIEHLQRTMCWKHRMSTHQA